MKAKTYYIHRFTQMGYPMATLERKPVAHSKPEQVLVIPVSSMDKVIEQVAITLCNRNAKAALAGYRSILMWNRLSKRRQEGWREIARAAYRAGGFIP
jgi:hypothetical protein